MKKVTKKCSTSAVDVQNHIGLNNQEDNSQIGDRNKWNKRIFIKGGSTHFQLRRLGPRLGGGGLENF